MVKEASTLVLVTEQGPMFACLLGIQRKALPVNAIYYH